MQFVELSNTLRGKWKKVSQDWLGLNNEFLELMDDLPAWWSENANMAQLGAAVWKSGGAAGVEFHTDRLNGGKGMVDGQFLIGRKSHWIEAKFEPRHLADLGRGSVIRESRLKSMLSRASEQLESVPNEYIKDFHHLTCILFHSIALKDHRSYVDRFDEVRDNITLMNENHAATLKNIDGWTDIAHCLFHLEEFTKQSKEWNADSLPVAFGFTRFYKA